MPSGNTYGLDSFSLGQIANSGVNIGQEANQSSYPTYPNAAGAGSQTAGQPTQAVAPTTPIGSSSNLPPNYTTGFNPWSMVGEANTR